MRRLAWIRRLIRNLGPRSRRVRGRGGLSSEPQDRTRLDAVRSAEDGPDSRTEPEALSGRWARCPYGKLTWIERDQRTTLFLLLIHRLVTVSYRTVRRIHIILDNFKIHDSLQVQLAPGGHREALARGNLPDFRWPGTLKCVGPLSGGGSATPCLGGSGSERWFPLMERTRWKRPLTVMIKAAVAVLVLRNRLQVGGSVSNPAE